MGCYPHLFYFPITVINSHFAQRERSLLSIYFLLLASISFAFCSLISFPFTKYLFITLGFNCYYIICHTSKDLGFIASFNRIPNLHLTLRRYRCLFSTLMNLIFQQSFCVLVRLWGLSLFDIANIRTLFNIASETLSFNMYLTQKGGNSPFNNTLLRNEYHTQTANTHRDKRSIDYPSFG